MEFTRVLFAAEIWDTRDVLPRSQTASERVLLMAYFSRCVSWRMEWPSTVRHDRDFCNSKCQVKSFKVLKAFVWKKR